MQETRDDDSAERTLANIGLSQDLRRIDGTRSVKSVRIHDSVSPVWALRRRHSQYTEDNVELRSRDWLTNGLLPPSVRNLCSLYRNCDYHNYVYETHPPFVISTIPKAVNYSSQRLPHPQCEEEMHSATGESDHPDSQSTRCQTRLRKKQLCLWTIDWEGREAKITCLLHEDKSWLAALYRDDKRRFLMHLLANDKGRDSSSHSSQNKSSTSSDDSGRGLWNRRILWRGRHLPRSRRGKVNRLDVKPDQGVSASRIPATPEERLMAASTPNSSNFSNNPTFLWRNSSLPELSYPLEGVLETNTLYHAERLLLPFDNHEPSLQEVVNFTIWATETLTGDAHGSAKPRRIHCRLPPGNDNILVLDNNPEGPVEIAGGSPFLLTRVESKTDSKRIAVAVSACATDETCALEEEYASQARSVEEYWREVRGELEKHPTSFRSGQSNT